MILSLPNLKMPGIGGLEVLSRLRKVRPDTTVIIFTGYASVDTAREALKMEPSIIFQSLLLRRK